MTTGGNAGDGGVDRAAPPTVAVVVGCGAIARMQHVPALAKHPGCGNGSYSSTKT